MMEIKSINSLLEMHLFIPNYQRPYKWTDRNVSDLLCDINNAISDAEKFIDFKYRIGTIILYVDAVSGEEKYGIVDGQQRIITLVLLLLYLDKSFACELLKTDFDNKITQANIQKNYRFINEWFSLKTEGYKNRVKNAFDKTLEAVIISVDKESEAFQLFDSQNARGRALDPHDLLKAYHLREMKNFPYEMQHAVAKWETVSSKEIKKLFELYLFPIHQWSSGVKSFSFSSKDIDTYKGVAENSAYTYAKRVSKAMPYFQITEQFIAGNDFFEMVEHYLELLSDINAEIHTNNKFSKIKEVLENKANNSTGFRYAKNLFFCALLCFYDRFRCFDEQVVTKLFIWAFMIRVDMTNLGFDSINKYAIGEYEYRYKNNIEMFSKIIRARLHSEIANIQITVSKEPNNAMNNERSNLYKMLQNLNGYSVEEV